MVLLRYAKIEPDQIRGAPGCLHSDFVNNSVRTLLCLECKLPLFHRLLPTKALLKGDKKCIWDYKPVIVGFF